MYKLNKPSWNISKIFSFSNHVYTILKPITFLNIKYRDILLLKSNLRVRQVKRESAMRTSFMWQMSQKRVARGYFSSDTFGISLVIFYFYCHWQDFPFIYLRVTNVSPISFDLTHLFISPDFEFSSRNEVDTSNKKVSKIQLVQYFFQIFLITDYISVDFTA